LEIKKKILAAQLESHVAYKAGTASIQIAQAVDLPARARPTVVPTTNAAAPMRQRARVSHAPTFAVLSIPQQAFALRYAPLVKLKL